MHVSWDPKPVTNGGYANIYRGKWKGQAVALKQLKSDIRNTKLVKVSFYSPLHSEAATQPPNCLLTLNYSVSPGNHKFGNF